MKKLVDPSCPDILALPHSKEELIRIINQSWYIVFDNISTVSDDFSDTFCRAVTGEGYIKRSLYTDDDNTVYEYKRCICLNGIDTVVNRPDLLDRSILIEMERIPKENRKAERAFWNDFENMLPSVLGSIFTVLSKTLAILPNVRQDQLERMADFTLFGRAVALALGQSESDFDEAYTQNITQQSSIVVDTDLVASTLLAFMKDKTNWLGTPSNLYAKLCDIAESEKQGRSFPKSVQTLSKRLKAVQVNLLELGIQLNFQKDSGNIR